MPVSGGGFEQSYNAQAAVDDHQTMSVVATWVSQAPNDKEQVLHMLETLQSQVAVLGPIEALVANTGYWSENNVEVCEALGITATFIAVARENHHPDWRQRHIEPEALAEDATRMQVP